MFKHFYQYQTLSEKNFLPAMTCSGSISVYPVEAVKAFNRADAFLTVAHSLPSGSAPSKMVIFFISKSRIDTLVSNLFGNAEGALYITDSDGTVIYAYNCNNSVDLSTNEIEKILSDQLQSVSIQGRDYLITADKENLYGWNYLLLSDQKQLFSHQYYLCKIMIFWLVFALLIVFVISTLLAMLNYKPIYRLMQLIPTNIKSNLDATAFQDEFQLIELIVEQSIDEKRSLQKKLFLSNLLWGQFDSSIDVQQTLQDINLSMEYDGYLVAILSYNNQSIEPKRLPTVLLDIETQIDNNYQQAVGMELYDQSGIVVLINYSTQHLKPDIIGNFLNSVYTRSGQNSTPNSNATNLHSSQKRCCSFCISSSNASPTFQVQKSIFHQMTKPIQVTVILPLLLAISLSWNDDIHSSISGISNDLIGVIPTIGQ